MYVEGDKCAKDLKTNDSPITFWGLLQIYFRQLLWKNRLRQPYKSTDLTQL